MSDTPNQEQYFATLPADKLAPEVMSRIEDYYKYLRMSGKIDLYRRSYNYYYKACWTGAATLAVGAQGELTQLNVNHYQNVLKNLITMTTSQRTAFEVRSTNTDEKSAAQTILGSGLLEYYQTEKKLETYFKLACTFAVQFGEGFVMSEWNATAGAQYGMNPDTNIPVYEGDMKYTAGSPLDCPCDFTKQNAMKRDWRVFRTYENKWDLVAKYPEYREKILHLSDSQEPWMEFSYLSKLAFESDDIPVWNFFHEKTPAVPEGRYSQILDDDLFLLDGPLPYRSVPIRRIAASEMVGTPFGYTVGFDLLPICESYDAMISAIMTNNVNSAVQNYWSPPGNNVNLVSLGGGLNLIESNVKPEVLTLLGTAPETYSFLDILKGLIELISAINSAVRGDPAAQLKSGTAIALVQSMAIQFNMDLQQSYAWLQSDVGTDTLLILRDFAKVPRVAAIVGKNNQQYMKEFSGDDLDQVNRVQVDMGNPLMRTTAGKAQLADALLEKGLIQDPQQYIMMLTTGKLEPMYEGMQSQLSLIRAENEALAEGQKATALMTDLHNLHLIEHMSVLSSPISRTNQQVVLETLTHIQDHINLYTSMNPLLAQLLNMPPPPPMPGIPTDVSAQLNPTKPVLKEAGQVQGPKAPVPPPGTPPQTAQHLQNAL